MGKYFFKKAMEPMLPHATLSTGPKMGFSQCRLARWLGGPGVRGHAMHWQRGRAGSYGLVRAPTITRMLDQHERGAPDHPSRRGCWLDVRRLPAMRVWRLYPAGWALISTRTKDEGFGFGLVTGSRVMRLPTLSWVTT